MNKATFDTLAGISKGQYDIRLGSDTEVGDFFEGVEQQDLTALGGFTLRVRIQPFEGANGVSPLVLQVRYMGPHSERRDWYVASQRPDTAYPLWRQGRGTPANFDVAKRNYLLLIKDSNNNFHARWVTDDSFDNVPEDIRREMVTKDIGVMNLASE